MIIITRLGKNLKVSEARHFDIQRKVVAHMTARAWDEIPHTALAYEPDVTLFMEKLKEYKKRIPKSAPNISFNTAILKVFAEGLKASPELNAHLEYNRKSKTGTLKIFDEINVSIPVIADDEGRDITPVLKDLGNKSVIEIASDMQELGRKLKNTNINELLFETSARERLSDLKRFKLGVLPSLIKALVGKHKVQHLKGKERKEYYQISPDDRIIPDDLISGTILISNVGSAYREFKGWVPLLMIIPPQTIVICTGPITKKPVVITENGEDKIAIRKILPTGIVFDHRAYDYFNFINFFKRMDEIFANPDLIFD